MKQLTLKTIKFYQKFISPLSGSNCRFYPSCSEYSYRVIKKYGTIKGVFFSFRRLLKCGPWNKGGINMP